MAGLPECFSPQTFEVKPPEVVYQVPQCSCRWVELAPPTPSNQTIRINFQKFPKIWDSGCSELSSYLFLINPWIVDVSIRTYDTSHLMSGGQSGDRQSTLYDGIYIIKENCTDSNTDSMDPWCCWCGLTVFLETQHPFSHLPKKIAHLKRLGVLYHYLIASLF